MATFQNLGMSLGTAIGGVLLIISLLNVSSQLIAQNTTLSDSQKAQLNTAYEQNAQIASNAQVEAATASLPPDVSAQVVDINAQARSAALSRVFILLGVMSLLGLVATIKLPQNKPGPKALG
jgi:hypothetical protein